MTRSGQLPFFTSVPFFTLVVITSPDLRAAEPDWSAIDVETLQHFQAMVRIDTVYDIAKKLAGSDD